MSAAPGTWGSVRAGAKGGEGQESLSDEHPGVDRSIPDTWGAKVLPAPPHPSPGVSSAARSHTEEPENSMMPWEGGRQGAPGDISHCGG